ncbi:MAG TPA: hypothetical protein VI979_01320 [archaeon]|nr:hypothetical protein [archaeon]
METEKMGEYAFLAGIAIAVLTGLASGAIAAYATWTSLLLALLGIVVGLLNISEKETTAFLVAAIALVTAGTASFAAIDMYGVGAILDGVVKNIAVLVSPAAVIVAVKAIYSLASGR